MLMARFEKLTLTLNEKTVECEKPPLNCSYHQNEGWVSNQCHESPMKCSRWGYCHTFGRMAEVGFKKQKNYSNDPQGTRDETDRNEDWSPVSGSGCFCFAGLSSCESRTLADYNKWSQKLILSERNENDEFCQFLLTSSQTDERQSKRNRKTKTP